jgi:hypothetical protein
MSTLIPELQPSAAGFRPGMVQLFHVVHPRWQPGQPLYPWYEAKTLGIFTDAEWQHRKVPVGYDGDLVSFSQDLLNAMTYAEGTDKRILRVWLWPKEIVINKEECPCHRGQIPADQIEVVPAEHIAAAQRWRDQIWQEVQRKYRVP